MATGEYGVQEGEGGGAAVEVAMTAEGWMVEAYGASRRQVDSTLLADTGLQAAVNVAAHKLTSYRQSRTYRSLGGRTWRCEDTFQARTDERVSTLELKDGWREETLAVLRVAYGRSEEGSEVHKEVKGTVGGIAELEAQMESGAETLRNMCRMALLEVSCILRSVFSQASLRG